MLKVVIFDSGWGGELFADYLEEELKVIEVIRELDWMQGSYCDKTKRKIRYMVEMKLKKYIGKVDLIILASYTISEAVLMYLIEKYPMQKFMGFRPRLAPRVVGTPEKNRLRYELREYRGQLDIKKRILFDLNGYGRGDVFDYISKALERGKRGAVLVLASGMVRKSREYKQDIRRLNSEYQVLEPCCEKLAKQIDEGMEISEIEMDNLPGRKDIKAVLIYGTTFVKMREFLSRKYGWKTKIYDDFQRSVAEVCVILNMRRVER